MALGIVGPSYLGVTAAIGNGFVIRPETLFVDTVAALDVGAGHTGVAFLVQRRSTLAIQISDIDGVSFIVVADFKLGISVGVDCGFAAEPEIGRLDAIASVVVAILCPAESHPVESRLVVETK